MENTVSKLIQRHKTNCPFTIARAMGIQVRFHDLGTNTRGIYYRKLKRRFIVIHNQLSSEWQRFVCAHELGHDRLHQGISRFFWRSIHFLIRVNLKCRLTASPLNYLYSTANFIRKKRLNNFVRAMAFPRRCTDFSKTVCD